MINEEKVMKDTIEERLARRAYEQDDFLADEAFDYINRLKAEKEQVCKDIAKRILTEWYITDCESGGFNLGYVEDLCKEYGVEVDDERL